jgi:hypothetical protein
MGIVYIDGLVAGSAGQQETVRFLVDSGATYTLLPNDTWRALGLSPKRTMTFSLADGTRLEREVSECHIILYRRNLCRLRAVFAPGDLGHAEAALPEADRFVRFPPEPAGRLRARWRLTDDRASRFD